MAYQRKATAERAHATEKSTAFLLGLYVGLVLLLALSWIDTDLESNLHKATNIYAVQALAGAVLVFWRVWKSAENVRGTPALVSVWICVGLLAWVIGQSFWTWDNFHGQAVPYPGLSDLFYILSDLLWLVALVGVYKSLPKRSLSKAFSPFSKLGIPILLSLFLTGVPAWIARRWNPSQLSSATIIWDSVYVLLTCLSFILAIGLLGGDEQRKNSELPTPIHRAFVYLCVASAIDAIGTLAFTVTEKLPEGYKLKYFNGGWVDLLFLTAMFLWGVAALKWPLTEDRFQYTLHTNLTLRLEGFYRASDIAQAHSPSDLLTRIESIRWILQNIPGCWKVAKLGDEIVGSTFLFPVPRQLMNRFLENAQPSEHLTMDQSVVEEAKQKEHQLFADVKNGSPCWDCLYLADASFLAKHRRRGLAFRSYRSTIDDITRRYPETKIDVYCWPVTPAQEKLADKLRDHFKNQILVNKIQ